MPTESMPASPQDANTGEGRERPGNVPQLRPVEGASRASVEEIASLVGFVAGQLSLAITRRFVRRQDVETYVRKLRTAANLLEQRFMGGSDVPPS